MSKFQCRNPDCSNCIINGYCSVTCGTEHMENMYGQKANSTDE